MRTSWIVAPVVAIAFAGVAASCGGSHGSSSSFTGSSGPSGVVPSPSPTPSPGSGLLPSPSPTPGASPSPSPSPSTGPHPDSGSPGSWGNRFLASGAYTSLLVEVDYVTGKQPAQASLNLLQQRLGERCNKPGGITVQLGTQIGGTTPTTYSVTDLQTLEAANRTSYASGTQAVLYFVCVNGKSTLDSSNGTVLGLTYTGTSIAIFEDNIAGASNLVITSGAIEQSVFVHEAGHTLGLVNIGAPLTTSHQDTAHGAHCTNQSCLMYWAIDSSNVIQYATNGLSLPTNFGSECLADLAANGGR